jgi:hypothetical protein
LLCLLFRFWLIVRFYWQIDVLPVKGVRPISFGALQLRNGARPIWNGALQKRNGAHPIWFGALQKRDGALQKPFLETQKRKKTRPIWFGAHPISFGALQKRDGPHQICRLRHPIWRMRRPLTNKFHQLPRLLTGKREMVLERGFGVMRLRCGIQSSVTGRVERIRPIIAMEFTLPFLLPIQAFVVVGEK